MLVDHLRVQIQAEIVDLRALVEDVVVMVVDVVLLRWRRAASSFTAFFALLRFVVWRIQRLGRWISLAFDQPLGYFDGRAVEFGSEVGFDGYFCCLLGFGVTALACFLVHYLVRLLNYLAVFLDDFDFMQDYLLDCFILLLE